MSFANYWSNQKIIAQLIIPKIYTDRYFEDNEYQNYIKNLVKLGIGGFCVFEGNTENVPIMIEQLQTIAEIPLIFCADFEYGLPMRLDEGTSFPHAMAISKTNDSSNSFKISQAIAKESKSINIYWNLAPVCDINNNPNNPIINIRSFGENSEKVSEFAIQYMKGLETEKVASCVKHFPGHGDTDIDSHINLPFINKSLKELFNNELIPFVNAIKNNVDSIMVGHLIVPSIDKDCLPLTISKNNINFIRNELKYDGIILTDALDMKSMTNKYHQDELAFMSLEAGYDIALMPVNPLNAIEILQQKVNSNLELRNQLIKSVERFIKLKRKVGLIPQYAKNTNDNQIFNNHLNLALKVAHSAIKIEGCKELLPLNEKLKIASFAILQTDRDMQSANRFFTMLAQAIDNDCDFAFIDDQITDENINSFIENIIDTELVIFPIFLKSVSYLGSISIDVNIKKAISKISFGRKSIIILFGNPYIKNELNADLIITTFSDSFASLAASIIYLTGREEILKFN
jgi:beta-glucosidase-like glycosyl hydrolase